MGIMMRARRRNRGRGRGREGGVRRRLLFRGRGGRGAGEGRDGMMREKARGLGLVLEVQETVREEVEVYRVRGDLD